MPTDAPWSWPALDLAGRSLPGQIAYQRGIWGKVHGAASDFRWIATTPAFTAAQAGLERELPLGGEDAPVSAPFWRTVGDICYAVAVYPSPAIDAAGRSGFLEKQILEWKRPPEVPAALGALLLLPTAAGLNSSVWWEQRTDIRWTERDFVLDLDASSPLPVSAAAVAQAVDKGLRELAGAVSEEGLTNLYATLLAGGRALPLRDLSAPLSPEALAALLLPLPRAMADTLSAASWLPSMRLSEPEALAVRRCWNLVLGGASGVTGLSAAGQPTPTPDQIWQARTMARSVFKRHPPYHIQATTGAVVAEPDPGRPVRLALWGPSASGKTALLAKLYLDKDEDWDVYPTDDQSYQFIQGMRDRMKTNNHFPESTTYGRLERISYSFKNVQTGMEASLEMEDRAGRESEELSPNLKELLGSADGLVLLFDPLSEEATLEAQVWRTLEFVHVASGRGTRKDKRPIAACISKADLLIQTPADFHRALKAPDDFVSEQVQPILVEALERFCENYRLFPVSAAGVRSRYGIIEPVVFYDEELKLRVCPGGEAFNLMAPFSWLLRELTAPS